MCNGLTPCIESFSRDDSTPLHTFRVRIVPKKISETYPVSLRSVLDANANMVAKVALVANGDTTRMDFRKQLDTLVQFLDDRQKITGESVLSFSTKDYGIRHLMTVYEGGLALPASRLGLLAVLDVSPVGSETITNLENCVTVVERPFGPDSTFPTCIVVFRFHCHQPRPSSVV